MKITKANLNLTPEQIEAYIALERIRMGWTILITLVVLLSVGFFAFLAAMFLLPKQEIAKGIVGGINLLLGWSVRTVVNHLFPPRKKV